MPGPTGEPDPVMAQALAAQLPARAWRLCGIPHKRHTHATLLLRDRESPNVVSERLGHASVTVTLGIYSHVLPGGQKAAAARFAALVRGAEA